MRSAAREPTIATRSTSAVVAPPTLVAGFRYELARLAEPVRYASTDLVTLSIGGNDLSPSDPAALRRHPLGWAAGGP